jgi:hypothetical protein
MNKNSFLETEMPGIIITVFSFVANLVKIAKNIPDFQHYRLLAPAVLASSNLLCGNMRAAHVST